MNKSWDSFRRDDPGTMRNRGERAGSHGSLKAENDTLEAAGRVAYGGGKRPTTYRCASCGKRDQFRNDHACGPKAIWKRELIDPYAAPPTMLAFQEWTRQWALEAMRVLKPGGHLLAFGGTRTYHRLAAGIEDAGFEIRDCISWLYGSGFPKSLDVSRAIDDAAGAVREVVGFKEAGMGSGETFGMLQTEGRNGDASSTVPVTAPATPEAAEWSGWGTALKPAFEPIVVARKPLSGTVAGTVLEHGTGGLNIDACRVGDEVTSTSFSETKFDFFSEGRSTDRRVGVAVHEVPGRWPANVALDEEAAALLDGQSGDSRSSGRTIMTSTPGKIYGGGKGIPSHTGVYGYEDEGGASRFFYVAKASTAEREAGIAGGFCNICATWVNAVQRATIPADLAAPPRRDTTAPTTPLAAVSDLSMTSSGKTPTAPSQMDLTFTTGTATSKTTDSTTSNSSRSSTTSENTPTGTVGTPTETGSVSAGSAASGSPRTASTSTSPDRDGLPTVDADLATSASSSRPSSSAALACPDCGGVVSGGRNNVHPLADGQAD